MKFSNGCWLNKDGVETFSPQEVYSTEIKDNELIMHAPCNRIINRGATLGGPVITYKITSPIKDVIRVQAYHYMGENSNKTKFEICENNPEVSINENDKEITFVSGKTKMVLNKEQWEMSFYHGDRFLTASKFKSLAYIKTEQEKFMGYNKDSVYMRDQLQLSVGELVYGLGEKFTPFVKNGQAIEMWNEDGGTSTSQSYKSIPFYITNRSYGVFVNDPGKVSFEVASEKVTKVQFSVPGESLDYFIVGGDSMKDVLVNYTSLTGKPSMPPAWSFGLWLTTSFTTNYDEKTVMGFVDGMAERDIPLHVFHFDCFWMKDFNWCNFEWDKRVFPDPKGMLKRIHDKGLKVCVWINPYISQESSLFEEGKEGGYFLKRPNGDVWQWDMWQPAMAIVDFTNPAACEWYKDKLRSLLDMGVDCFKTDFGERIPTEAKYFDGSDPEKMHNFYTYLYNKTVFDVLEERKGKGQAALFARSATVGGQKFPVHWGGDCDANYESMSESLRGGLSLCMSGFGFWSHDIGGFESTSTPDVYKRWAAFGLLSSHSRLHGSTSYRVPWLYDEEAVDVVRFFSKLKCSIMPYIYRMADTAATKGVPVMRSMVLEFTDDPTCGYTDRQYMLGDSILVSPIFNDRGEAQYYLPEGKWTNFISGKVYEGGRWVDEHHDYLSIPMMVRENSIIPVGSENRKPDYDYRENVTLNVYELKDDAAAKCEVLGIEREVELKVEVIKHKHMIIIKSEGNDKAWSLVLKNVNNISMIDGAKFEVNEDDTKIMPTSGTCEIKCYLE